MRLLAVCIILHLAVTTATAQEEPEYRVEVGAGAGSATYLGDYNGNLLKGIQPWGALTGKYRFTPRTALALSVGFSKFKGNSSKAGTWYPGEQYSFDKQMIDAGVRVEYNFWAYGTGREYRGARRVVPFITLGIGATYHANPESGVAFNLPLGAGVKVKVATRLNLSAEWRMHFTFSDKLDGVKDPYGIKSSGLFKNCDGFCILQIALTYDLWEKCKTCNNDRY